MLGPLSSSETALRYRQLELHERGLQILYSKWFESAVHGLAPLYWDIRVLTITNDVPQPTICVFVPCRPIRPFTPAKQAEKTTQAQLTQLGYLRLKHAYPYCNWVLASMNIVYGWVISWAFNTMRPRQIERHFPDDIFKCIFENENVLISPKISLKFVRKVPTDNNSVLV